jgi:hypothetical protein
VSGEQAEVWILHERKTVLVQVAGLGVPDVAVVASDGTIGGTLYDTETLLGPYPMPSTGWGEAGEVGRQKATELGYKLGYHDPVFESQFEEEGDDYY